MLFTGVRNLKTIPKIVNVRHSEEDAKEFLNSLQLSTFLNHHLFETNHVQTQLTYSVRGINVETASDIGS